MNSPRTDRQASARSGNPTNPASHRGRTSYHAGLAAEDSVAHHFAVFGYKTVAQRWRGTHGEIDLILKDEAGFVFVEVKQSKTFDTALSHVTPAQIRRLYATVEEFLATTAKNNLTDVRFDIALVDGTGAVKVLENAFRDVF